MDEKEIKVSESIKILGEVSISRRQQFTEKYSSESKSIGDFDFDEFSSTSYCSESYDDEVFVEPDDFERTMKEIRVIHDPRKRRTSDVIDSMGDTPPKEKAHFFPNDFFDVEGPSFKFGSPPITPESITKEAQHRPTVPRETNSLLWVKPINYETSEQSTHSYSFLKSLLKNKELRFNTVKSLLLVKWKSLSSYDIKIITIKRNGSIKVKCIKSSFISKLLGNKKPITFHEILNFLNGASCPDIGNIEDSEIIQELHQKIEVRLIKPRNRRSTLFALMFHQDKLPKMLHSGYFTVVHNGFVLRSCCCYNCFQLNNVSESCSTSTCGKSHQYKQEGKCCKIKCCPCCDYHLPISASYLSYKKKSDFLPSMAMQSIPFYNVKRNIYPSDNSSMNGTATTNASTGEVLFQSILKTFERIESNLIQCNNQKDNLNKQFQNQGNSFEDVLSSIALRLSNLEKEVEDNIKTALNCKVCSKMKPYPLESPEIVLAKSENKQPHGRDSSASGSDMGYYSNCGPSTPPSLLDFKPAWSRVSSFSDGPSIEDKKQDNPVVDQTDGGDESDAKPNRPPSYTHPNTHEAKMPVARDSPEYNMNHPRRGCAHIFNHDTFSNLMPPRKGSDVDVKELATVYELLGFDVEVHQNLDYAGLQTVIQRIVKEDYTDCDCISIAVLTHGQESNLLYTSDCLYSVESLWQSFTPDKCPTLAGKPKLFFIQACRGQKLDGGTTLGRYTTETDSASDSYKIPKMADFLIAYSTADGYYSWRNPENGTWFVQSLCHVLREHHQTTDLLRMLTIVSRKVAVEHESYSDIRLDLNAQKQVPSISSTLIRDVFLRSK